MIAVQTVSGASASVRARHDAAGAVSSSAHHVAIEKSLRIIASLPRKTLQLSSITATRGCSRYDRDRRQGGRLRDADPDARRCDTGEAQNQWPGLARRHLVGPDSTSAATLAVPGPATPGRTRSC